MDKSKLNTFRIAVADRETALVKLERAAYASQLAYFDNASTETVAILVAEHEEADRAHEATQINFEAAMQALGLTDESSAEIVRALGGRAFDPETGDVR